MGPILPGLPVCVRTPDARVPRSPSGDRGTRVLLGRPQPMRRMAVMAPTASMLATFTTSPDVGAWTICPFPM